MQYQSSPARLPAYMLASKRAASSADSTKAARRLQSLTAADPHQARPSADLCYGQSLVWSLQHLGRGHALAPQAEDTRLQLSARVPGPQGMVALCPRLLGGTAKEAEAERLPPRLKTPGCSCCAPHACCACHLYGMKPCPGAFARLCPGATRGGQSTPPALGADAKLLLRPCANAPAAHHMLRSHPTVS